MLEPEPIRVELPNFNHELDLNLNQGKDSLDITRQKLQDDVVQIEIMGLKNPISVEIPELAHEADIQFSQSKQTIKVSSLLNKLTVKQVAFSGLEFIKAKANIPTTTVESSLQLAVADDSVDLISNKGKLEINGTEVFTEGLAKPLVSIPQFSVNGIDFNLKEQQLDIANVNGKNAEIVAWLIKTKRSIIWL